MPRDSLFVAAILAVTLLTAPLSILALPYSGDGPAVAVIAPWSDVDAVLASNGLRQIAPTRAPFGVLVTPVAGFTPERRNAGLITLLDGQTIAKICGVTNV